MFDTVLFLTYRAFGGILGKQKRRILTFDRGQSIIYILGNTAQMRLRILTDLFRQKFVCKTLKYTKYSCGFPPFSDEKSLVRLS